MRSWRARAAREFAKNFTLEEAVDRLEDLYYELLS